MSSDDDAIAGANKEDSRHYGGGASIGGRQSELPLMPSNISVPIQRQYPQGVKAKNDEGATTTIGTNNMALAVDWQRKKRDYVSDAVERMKQAVANAQQQLQQQQNSNGSGAAAIGVPSVNSGSAAIGGLPDTQIIPIPPLSDKIQNIVFVSENGNVTLRRGQNFMSVETVMMPQQQQQKN